MIIYEAGGWGIKFIFQISGSVFPRAVTWAIPSAAAAFVVQTMVDHSGPVETVVSQAWFAMSFVVGFLIVFRTQQGYSRYWEGASLLQSVKAYWLNATSNLVSFCTTKPEKAEEVAKFQHLLVRLISLLHCSSLQSVSMMDNNDFDILDVTGLSPEFLEHVHSHEDNKCFIVLQAVQQLIVENIRLGNLDIAPPIISRVFQELSNGIVAVSNVRKITDIPFPFPYAQLVTVMLLISWCTTPLVTGILLKSPYWACSLTFVGQFGFWSINYIAQEIENPFGDDANDLPINEMQREMNECLKLLMHPYSQKSPSFDFSRENHTVLVAAKSSSALNVPTKRGKRTGMYHPNKIFPSHPHLPHIHVPSVHMHMPHLHMPGHGHHRDHSKREPSNLVPPVDSATEHVMLAIQEAPVHGQLDPTPATPSSSSFIRPNGVTPESLGAQESGCIDTLAENYRRFRDTEDRIRGVTAEHGKKMMAQEQQQPRGMQDGSSTGSRSPTKHTL